MALALALNLDSIDIARRNMSNQSQRQAVLARSNHVPVEQMAGPGADNTAQLQQTLEQLKQAIADANAQIGALNTAGFPVT